MFLSKYVLSTCIMDLNITVISINVHSVSEFCPSVTLSGKFHYAKIKLK